MGPELFAGGTVLLTIVLVCGSVLFTLLVTAAAIAIPIYFMRNNQKRVRELMNTGTQGEATILSLDDTGMRINDNPRVTLGLEIRMPNLAPYQVKKTVTISLIRISQVQVGAVVPVMVDMTDFQNPEKIGLLLK
jgi:hypothetical protein